MAIAGSATWKLNPANGNWNRAGNWMPPTVPNAFSDTATFGVSNVTDVSFSANTEVSAITFTSGASAFTITVAPGLQLSLSGTGISNNSQSTQNFVIDVDGANQGQIQFTGNARMSGTANFANNGGTVADRTGGFIQFFATSSAGSAHFINRGAVATGAAGGASISLIIRPQRMAALSKMVVRSARQAAAIYSFLAQQTLPRRTLLIAGDRPRMQRVELFSSANSPPPEQPRSSITVVKLPSPGLARRNSSTVPRQRTAPS